MANRDEIIDFYDNHYDVVGNWFVQPGQKIMLGEKGDRICRFCGKGKPEVTFRKVAHAIPEGLGNKSIESRYECDTCNELFGQGIENDLGNWSKPMRTFARIRGKSGVPTTKKGGDGLGWRIEYGQKGFKISSYEDDPLYEIDEVNKKITFSLKRDAYTPVAVLKAFMKIGLTLLPEDEVKNFPHLFSWVRDIDHSNRFADQCPIIYTFQPGPMPSNLIAALILRRKPNVTGYAYCYLVLGYGNEIFQVQLPSEEYDAAMNGKSTSIHPFPSPGSPDPSKFGPPRCRLLDLTGREIVRGEIVPAIVGYELANRIPPSASGASEV